MAPIASMYSIPVGFLILILIGAGLLMLPCATTEGNHTSFLTAMFTSTTSVCVTGSVVVDTYTHWTTFGKAVILGLIQLGGLGIIAAVAFLAVVARRTFSLGDMLTLKDMFSLDTTKGIVRFFNQIVVGTLLAELIGALLYMPAFCSQFGALKGIWYSIFTSISAFCNAGITIMDSNSLDNYSDSPYVLTVTMLMIIGGGMGYVFWADLLSIIHRIRNKEAKAKYSLKLAGVHTHLVLALTLVLIFGGALLFFILEYSNPGTLGNMPLEQKISNSLFQSVTTRTAGFTSVSQENLTETSSLLGDVLMFIGGSPLGTAGGVKTVTIFIVIMNVIAFLRNRNEVVILRRKIPASLIRKATAIVTVQLSVVLTITALVLATSGTTLTEALYETTSAVSTVGLSRGLTPELTASGQCLIMLGMFLGRIGPITMLLFFQQDKDRKDGVHYADGNYIVG